MEYVILVIVLGVLAIVSAGWLLFVRPRRGRAISAPTTEPKAASGQAADPPGAPPAATVDIERAPPSAGRLVRLRARLARSQSSVGGALLNLLSRDRLDDETWDEI